VTEPQPNAPLGAGVVHRLRRPGRAGRVDPLGSAGETAHTPGELGARSVRFAGALVPRSLPHAEPAGTGPLPGRTLAGAIRTEVPVHRLASVQAAGSMLVPRDLIPLQA
jgi:hypothetical protein